jgi:transposase
MVLLSSRGYSLAQIAAIFECEEATVRQWLERYQQEGDSGLQDRPRSGRPRKADLVARTVIRHVVEQTPPDLGYGFTCWTVATLAAHLAQRLPVPLSAATVRRVLHALTYRWRRPRHTLPVDPAAARIMWGLYDQSIQAPAESLVLCLDESNGHLLPVVRAMWMRRGQQARVLTPGTNRKRASEFIAFLEQLRRAYPGQPLLLVLDNASIHKARAVEIWLEQQAQVCLLYLPAYSGHRHNRVEKVWWRLKGQIAANRLHGSIDALVAAIHTFFIAFPPEDALRLAA